MRRSPPSASAFGAGRRRSCRSVARRSACLYGATEIADEQKLTMLLAHAAAARAPGAAIEAFIATLAEDVETREILRLVAAGEAATIAWLTAYRDAARTPRPAESARS
jgi:hypothetical protein